ncbi:hypothetical protein [Paenibacillus kribbensis]|uniref:hypothetical protein n=1 Tax=Paenibacillus kribbensis TaxID=172713 RepID=UPI002118A22D|nr:hypothetical protein [Paenibacillus kribbensis]
MVYLENAADMLTTILNNQIIMLTSIGELDKALKEVMVLNTKSADNLAIEYSKVCKILCKPTLCSKRNRQNTG